MKELPIYYSLIPSIQHYDWGSSSEFGYIRNFIKKKYDFLLNEKPLAELWMGAHKRSSSLIQINTNKVEELNELIKQNPDHFLGLNLSRKTENRKLPFLFKILDIEKPLSIQAHPDKKLAEILHKRNPEYYPDENHKPELAVCLENFKAIVGFRKNEQIFEFYQNTPIKDFIEVSDPKKITEIIYKKIMQSTSEEIQTLAEKFLEFLKFNTIDKKRDEWFIKLIEIYSKKDPGIFSIYLFNFFELKKGEGIFLAPNIPHAYLDGIVLECMADSDNVVRGGLTTKFKDIEVLISMLNYDQTEIPIYKSKYSKEGFRYYDIPVKDFQLIVIHNKEEEFSQLIQFNSYPSIVIVIEGWIEVKINNIESKKILLESGGIYYFPGDIVDRKIDIVFKPSLDCVAYAATIPKST